MLLRVDSPAQMSVFKADGSWGTAPGDGDARFQTNNLYTVAGDGSLREVAPRGSGWTLVRLRPGP
jgi:hypothetical protein